MGPSVAVAGLCVCVLLGSVSLVTAAKPRTDSRRAPRTELSHPCDRALSRKVRQRFQAHVGRQLKAISRTGTLRNWSETCPFNSKVDLWGWHERNKTRSKEGPRSSEWVCNYTGKTFKTEHYIDLHMEANFMKMSPENGTCLADYCEVFGFCNVVEPSFFESLSSEPPPCDPIALEAQQRICQSISDRCAPLDDPEAPNLNADLRRTLCDPLTCEYRTERHLANRKLSLLGGALVSVLLIGMTLCCLFGPKPEADERSYARDQRYRNAGKRQQNRARDQAPKGGFHAGSSEPGIVDMIPTKAMKEE